jgi:GTP-binding protein Era
VAEPPAEGGTDLAAGGAAFRCGFVALVGRPNVGKSTLLNRLVGHPVAIVTDVPQTTRVALRGIRHLPGAQVVYIDTPGIHKPRHRLNEEMVRTATEVLGQVDRTLVLVDASDGYGPGDRYVFERVAAARAHAFLVLNKVDRMRKEDLLPLIEEAARLELFEEIVPISATTGDNCDRLERLIVERLPEGPAHYPADMVTDLPLTLRAGEAIRAEILTRTRQELPHATAVVIEGLAETPSLVRIDATIWVEKETQKGIVIGDQGRLIKDIGTAARHRLEEMLGRKVHLALWVKVRAQWRDEPSLLRMLGITPQR